MKRLEKGRLVLTSRIMQLLASVPEQNFHEKALPRAPETCPPVAEALCVQSSTVPAYSPTERGCTLQNLVAKKCDYKYL
eukprot:3081301-Amphidinium_carterae.1